MADYSTTALNFNASAKQDLDLTQFSQMVTLTWWHLIRVIELTIFQEKKPVSDACSVLIKQNWKWLEKDNNALEIRVYMSGRSLLGIKLVDINREICDIFGNG